MAYNNGFPMGYQQPQMMYPQPAQIQPLPQATQPQPQINTGINWVQGEAGAKAYPVAPNTTVDLWDSEEQVIYLKSADMSGMPSMKILDYTIRDVATHKNNVAEKQIVDPSNYVTLEEFDSRIAELNKRLDNLSNKAKQHEYKRNNPPKERDNG